MAMTGCASEVTPRQDQEPHIAARAAVADLSRGLYRYGTDVIDDYARWADEDTQRVGVELIGYEQYPDVVHGDPFGALRFRSTVSLVQSGEPYAACFESEFDFWGVETGEPGGWEDDEAVAHDIECPPDASRIPPPIDTRTVQVVPEGTEALVLELLTNAPTAASADEIVAQVLDRLALPQGEREEPFEPRALVVDGDIGFAMGDADDCLLAKRDSEGVMVLAVPEILLQPGELGCNPETALLPVDQLRPPH